MSEPDLPVCVAALYRFAVIPDCAAIRAPLADLCRAEGIKGTLLLAREGINGTIAGSDGAIARVIAAIGEILLDLGGFAELEVKYSRAAALPFHRMKVRIKREIVTMGQPHIDPLAGTGHYVAPHDWNALIADPGTIVIDTRNDYEVAIGTFAGAIDPQTRSFRDFPAWFRAERARLLGEGASPKVAMFCTGGIRCEKSTAFLKAEGVDEVYHLQGGILKYLETVPAQDSLWQGECFVFDARVAVGQGLAPGTHLLCHACRRPMKPADQASPLFEEGVSCPACHAERTDEQRAGYRERHRQETIAAARGETHIGAMLPDHAAYQMADTASAPVLYSFRRCPYAMRARLALLVSGQACEIREVKLSAKPAELLAASAKATVPVLVLTDGRVIDESLDVMRWALARHDPERWLDGDDDALIAANDGPFKHALDRTKYPDRHGSDPAVHREAGLSFLETLEARLAVQPNLCGPRMALADAAILPFVRQFAAIDSAWFAAQALPAVQAWLARHLALPLFDAAMVRLKPWQYGDAPVTFAA